MDRPRTQPRTRTQRRALAFAGFALWSLILALRCSASVDYATAVKPLLQGRCYACHGALKQKAGLRLDTVDLLLRGGESGPAVLPGKPEQSPLVQRIATRDLAERMPPEHEGEPFSEAQLNLFRAWITEGAKGPARETPESDPKDHWAFRPPTRPAVPDVADPRWARNPIDAFIAREREQIGIQPQPEADPLTLLRRLSFDLIGLPPTSADLRAFTPGSRSDAYDQAVTRLLGDPRHGERWARHWMDIWRYSDSYGLGDQHRNSQKHIWHWRDWILESLNRDLPYDEMIRLMLAADESHPNDPDRLRATGFLARNYFLFNRNQWLDETVEHVGKGLLGLTLNCAKCHDHKYDPVAQTDYYRMRAFFEPYHARLDVVPGETDLNRDGLPRVYDRQLDVPTYRFVRGQENAPDTSKPMEPGVPGLLAFAALRIQPVQLPIEAREPERRPWVIPAYLEAARSRLTKARGVLALAKLAAASSGAPDDDPTVHLARLDVEVAVADLDATERRAEAQRARWNGVPAERELRLAAVRAERALAAVKAQRQLAAAEIALQKAPADKQDALAKEHKDALEKAEQARRLAESPPPEGAVYTPFPGTAWTATRFLDSTKDDPSVDLPAMSTGRRTALAAWITDPRHPLTARVAVNHVWTRHFGVPLVPSTFDFGRKTGRPIHADLIDWLAAEFVDSGWSLKHLHRLIVTSATYRMSSSQSGANQARAKDPDNLRWWHRPPIRLEAQAVRDAVLEHAGRLEQTVGGPPVAPGDQESSRRRSLYFYHSNNDRNLLLATFDDATVKECYRREQSIVPQQALALLNSRLVHEASASIARRLERDGEATATALPQSTEIAFVRSAFTQLLGFRPGPAEEAAAIHALRAWRESPDSESSPTLEGASPVADPHALLVWALLNHNDFVTLR